MAYGFENNKMKADFTAAINAIVDPLKQQINELYKLINQSGETLYPIGAIYISTSSTNPGFIFGGTWESYANGRFLMGIEPSKYTSHSAGETGGTDKQTINIDYEHSHSIQYPDTGDHIFAHGNVNLSSPIHQYILGPEIPATSADIETGKFQLLPVSSASGPFSTDTQGTTKSASKTISTLPPYITVYMWRRIG